MPLTHQEMSRKGGSAKSAKKTQAVRKNLQKAQEALARKRSQGSGAK